MYESSWTVLDESRFFDILYLLSSLKGKNRALRHFARLRLLGQDVLSFRNAKKILRNLLSKSSILIFFPALNSRRDSPQRCLEFLRKKGVVKSNDFDFFRKFLILNEVDKVVVITTLKDAQTYDLVSAANHLSISSNLILDSWDNIGCSAAIPEISGELILWSKQQSDEVKIYYPELAGKCRIMGTPRRLTTTSVQEERILHQRASSTLKKNKPFAILILQGYFFDDTLTTLKNIEKILIEIKEKSDFEFSINVRCYPLKAPSNRFKLDMHEFVESRRNSRVKFSLSGDVELRDDLIQSDIVISEISTGGLEACLAGIPTLFVFSSHNFLYMNGRKILDFKYAHDLIGKAHVVNAHDLERIKNTILAYISQISDRQYTNAQELEQTKQSDNWDYFASSFDEESFRILLRGPRKD